MNYDYPGEIATSLQKLPSIITQGATTHLPNDVHALEAYVTGLRQPYPEP